MKFFTIYEFLNSLLAAILYGVGMGAFYKAAVLIFFSLRSLILLPVNVFKVIRKFSFTEINKISKIESSNTLSVIGMNILEFVLFSIFGIGAIMLFYATLDGVVRFYLIFIILFSFIFSKNTVGNLFGVCWKFIFSKIYYILLVFASSVIMPFYRLLGFIYVKLHNALLPLYTKIIQKKSLKIEKRKNKEILSILQ